MGIEERGKLDNFLDGQVKYNRYNVAEGAEGAENDVHRSMFNFYNWLATTVIIATSNLHFIYHYSKSVSWNNPPPPHKKTPWYMYVLKSRE